MGGGYQDVQYGVFALIGVEGTKRYAVVESSCSGPDAVVIRINGTDANYTPIGEKCC